MTNQDLIDKFQKLHQQLVGLVNQVPANLREQVLFDKWSLKDILAHISAWNLLTTDRVKGTRRGELFPWVEDEDLDKFNQEEILKRRNLGWNKIHGELIKATEEMINMYKNLEPN